MCNCVKTRTKRANVKKMGKSAAKHSEVRGGEYESKQTFLSITSHHISQLDCKSMNKPGRLHNLVGLAGEVA